VTFGEIDVWCDNFCFAKKRSFFKAFCDIILFKKWTKIVTWYFGWPPSSPMCRFLFEWPLSNIFTTTLWPKVNNQYWDTKTLIFCIFTHFLHFNRKRAFHIPSRWQVGLRTWTSVRFPGSPSMGTINRSSSIEDRINGRTGELGSIHHHFTSSHGRPQGRARGGPWPLWPVKIVCFLTF